MSDRAPDVEPACAVDAPSVDAPSVDAPPIDAPRADESSTHRPSAPSDVNEYLPMEGREPAARSASVSHRWSGADVHLLPVDSDVEPEDRAPGGPVGRRRPALRVIAERRDVLAVIAVGGALGALARWGTSVAWPAAAGTFPWATLQVNALGAFLIGVLMVLVRARGRETRLLRPFLGVGVLGGYTTFSTYGLDIHQLLLDHRPGLAGAYLVASVALGLVGAWLGVVTGGAVARSLPDRDGSVA